MKRAALLLLAGATPLLAQEPPDRRALDLLAARLEEAAGRVSVPAPAFLGGMPTRAYRIPGVGPVVVLAPRVLPPPARRRTQTEAPLDPAVVRASRAQLERALFELRTSLERNPQAAVVDIDLRELERQAQERLAAAARARVEAYRALGEAMSDYAGPPTVTASPSPSPVPPAETASAITLKPLVAPRGPARLVEAVERVRTAVRDALPRVVSELGDLPDTESVSVAVDFMAPGSGPGAPPRRTLVLRARLGELRKAGSRPLPTLVEVSEY